ncbi:hypothetical protein ACSSS7_000835 [Eimeria intestinalis]
MFCVFIFLTLASRLSGDSFNSRQTTDGLGQIRSQIDGIQNIMIDSIGFRVCQYKTQGVRDWEAVFRVLGDAVAVPADKILQRGERIDLLVDQSEQLNQEAVTFRRQARRLKNSLWWRNAKFLAIIIGIVSGLGFRHLLLLLLLQYLHQQQQQRQQQQQQQERLEPSNTEDCSTANCSSSISSSNCGSSSSRCCCCC